MRPILINNEIETMALKYSSDLFSKKGPGFVKPLTKLKEISAALDRKKTLKGDYRVYVDKLISLIDMVNYIKPSEFQRFHDDHFAGFALDLDKKIKIKTDSCAFHKHISAAMRYDAVRDKEFLPYVRALGIRSCVYCNANYALSINTGAKDYGKFELDHFWPQSKFPYFCTNFYNLTPCCSNCNKYKLDKDSQFCLYSSDHTGLEQFDFELEKRSIVKYMLFQNPDVLEIKFSARHHQDHGRLFKIQATYDVLKDVAEEIIWKSKIYNGSYLKSLNNSFGRKFLSGNFHRFLLGNYDRPQDIHKRPLSKMTQDIAKQLGMIE
jgi:hypothetical protein